MSSVLSILLLLLVTVVCEYGINDDTTGGRASILQTTAAADFCYSVCPCDALHADNELVTQNWSVSGISLLPHPDSHTMYILAIPYHEASVYVLLFHKCIAPVDCIYTYYRPETPDLYARVPS